LSRQIQNSDILKQGSSEMTSWTFITNHAAILSLIARNPDITAAALAIVLGITERSVRRIIADLYDNNYITKKRKGRNVIYHINEDEKLKHPTHKDVAVTDLLDALGCKEINR